MAMDQISFALVGFDSITLLIPQRAIATIEMITSLDTESDIENTVGGLSATGKRWPVYALSADFSLQSRCPATSKYCVAFNVEAQPAFAITCDEVSSLTLTASEQIIPLQDCMRSPGSPLEGLLLREDRVMLCSSEQAMHEFLRMDMAA
jgi:hypothetical protein